MLLQSEARGAHKGELRNPDSRTAHTGPRDPAVTVCPCHTRFPPKPPPPRGTACDSRGRPPLSGCDECPDPIPECQEGEALTVDRNTTELCCPLYQCGESRLGRGRGREGLPGPSSATSSFTESPPQDCWLVLRPGPSLHYTFITKALSVPCRKCKIQVNMRK